MTSAPSTAPPPPIGDPISSPAGASRTFSTRVRFASAWQKLSNGELGVLPVVIGLVVIAVVFQSANGRFLSAQNLSNLLGQITSTGVIAVGIVLVLLLGEIDLSVGSVSGLTSTALVILDVQHGWPVGLAILTAVAMGSIIGLLHGLVFTKAAVPSFVLTLAGLIGWQGLQLFMLGKNGTINVPYNGGIAKLANTFYPTWVGYLTAAGVAITYVVACLRQRRRRQLAGLHTRSLFDILGKAAVLLAALSVAVGVLGQWQGVPLSLIIFGGVVTLTDLMLSRSRFGRRIYAVGGNAEAARRAGINIDRTRITVFILCSSLAAAGGLLAASRLFAVNQQSGGGDVLLNAIAAAVIGGTSLFGGRGNAYSALLGMVVIGSVSNGMDLLNKSSSVKFMITGAVLLAAVVIDSLSRRKRRASGRS